MTKKPKRREVTKAFDALTEDQREAIRKYMHEFATAVAPFLEFKKVSELAKQTVAEGVPIVPQVLLLDVLLQVCDKNFALIMKDIAGELNDVPPNFKMDFREPFRRYLAADCPFHFSEMFELKSKSELN
jgi:hypothetical protein